MQDFKKRIQRIKGYIKIFRDSEEGKEWILDAIEQEINELAFVLNSGETFFEKKEEVFQLQDLLRDVINTLKSDLKKKGVIIEIELDETLSPIKAESLALKKALIHVLKKFISNMSIGESLIIRGVDEKKKVKIDVLRGDGASLYSISVPTLPKGKELISKILEKEYSLGSFKGIILIHSIGTQEILELYGDKHFMKLTRKMEEQIKRVIREGDRYLSDGEGRFLLILNNIKEELQLERVRKRVQGVLDRIKEEEQSLSFKLNTTFLSPDILFNEILRVLEIS